MKMVFVVVRHQSDATFIEGVFDDEEEARTFAARKRVQWKADFEQEFGVSYDETPKLTPEMDEWFEIEAPRDEEFYTERANFYEKRS